MNDKNLMDLTMDLIQNNIRHMIIHTNTNNLEFNMDSKNPDDLNIAYNHYDYSYDNKAYALYMLLSDINCLSPISYIEKVYNFE